MVAVKGAIQNHEKKYVDPLVRGFISYKGRNNSVSIKHIVIKLTHSKYNTIQWNAERVYRMARYIRNTGRLVGLCFEGGKFYVASNANELKDHIGRLEDKKRIIEQDIEILSNQLVENYS